MKCNGLLLLITTLFFSSAYAEITNQPSPSTKIQHVIYITLDGIRWQDMYQTQAYFSKLWSQHANNLTFYGMPNSNTTMEVASVPI